jgi:hypothetical protein
MRHTLRHTHSAAVFLMIAVVVVASTPAGSVSAKTFPAGCWIGKTSYGGTYASGGVNAKVTNGKQTFVLWVSNASSPLARVAVGYIKQSGSGFGTLTISGSKLALQLKIAGDYELNGSASHVVATGRYTLTGVAKGTGQFLPSIPVKLRYPVNGAVLTVKTVTATKVSGLFLKAPWSATKRAGAPSKSADACSDAS